jgi:hypothetical protein
MNTPSVEFYNASADWERSHVDEAPPGPDWRWRLRAANGEIVATGESNRDEADARRAFEDMTLAVFGLYGYAFAYAMHEGTLPGMVPDVGVGNAAYDL